VSRIEQSGRMSLRRPKPPIKGGSAPEEEEEEEEEEYCKSTNYAVLSHIAFIFIQTFVQISVMAETHSGN